LLGEVSPRGPDGDSIGLPSDCPRRRRWSRRVDLQNIGRRGFTRWNSELENQRKGGDLFQGKWMFDYRDNCPGLYYCWALHWSLVLKILAVWTFVRWPAFIPKTMKQNLKASNRSYIDPDKCIDCSVSRLPKYPQLSL